MLSVWYCIHPLPRQKIIALPSRKHSVLQFHFGTNGAEFLSERVEDIVGKGENALAFSPFPAMLSKDLTLGRQILH